MTEAQKRQLRCAFTGPRPEHCSISQGRLRDLLRSEAERAYADGLRVFISGGARGVDLLAADIVLRLRDRLPDIRLICALPFPGFDARWDDRSRAELGRILAAADLVLYVSREYHPGCYRRRNEWMVDHAARIIAAWDGRGGGTANTVAYADSIGVPVRNILDT